jgi:hypothetical protein
MTALTWLTIILVAVIAIAKQYGRQIMAEHLARIPVEDDDELLRRLLDEQIER